MVAVHWGMLQVLAETERAVRADLPAAARARLEWERCCRPPGPRPARTLAGWLGDRLVTAGERLRAWSVADTAPAWPRR